MQILRLEFLNKENKNENTLRFTYLKILAQTRVGMNLCEQKRWEKPTRADVNGDRRMRKTTEKKTKRRTIT